MIFVDFVAVSIDESSVPIGFAGDSAVVTLTGIDVTGLSIGIERVVECSVGMPPIGQSLDASGADGSLGPT